MKDWPQYYIENILINFSLGIFPVSLQRPPKVKWEDGIVSLGSCKGNQLICRSPGQFQLPLIINTSHFSPQGTPLPLHFPFIDISSVWYILKAIITYCSFIAEPLSRSFMDGAFKEAHWFFPPQDLCDYAVLHCYKLDLYILTIVEY